MQRMIALIRALVLIVVLAGCDDSAAPDPLAQIYRANQELERQCDAQSRVIFVMGGALILLGAGLAAALGGILWRKGGRPRATTCEKTAAN